MWQECKFELGSRGGRCHSWNQRLGCENHNHWGNMVYGSTEGGRCHSWNQRLGCENHNHWGNMVYGSTEGGRCHRRNMESPRRLIFSDTWFMEAPREGDVIAGTRG